ncbi:MAG: DUF2017 family protein [Acidimicrobiia bacterium]|nr:DUF2017 family protein [Acidimicrobiia bacterium]
MSRFRAGSDGIAVALDASEITVLLRLGSLLGSAGMERRDPARARLNPSLYPGDESASREFDRLAAKELAKARSIDRERFAETLRTAQQGSITLAGDDAASWARVLAESRLVLAARNGGVTAGRLAEQPADPETALIGLLGSVLEDLVVVMLESMEDES